MTTAVDRSAIPLDQRCAFTAELRADDMSGTAPSNTRFLLIEQPGAWGRIAVEQSQLDRGVGSALATACGGARTRPLLIRRPGRTETPLRKRWYLAHTSAAGPTMRTGTVGADEELLGLLDAKAPGEPASGPIYAICTHGKHDACCAIRGRPVARKLGLELGDPVWEVSHLGGDRFAGNLVVLPWGLYYGRVDRENVDEIVAATDRGEVVPEFLRGCSAFAPAAQAAQAFARARSGDNRITAHTPRSMRSDGDHTWQVTLDGPDSPDGPDGRDSPDGSSSVAEPWHATVQRRPAGPPEFLTCSARAMVAPPTWSLLDLLSPDGRS